MEKALCFSYPSFLEFTYTAWDLEPFARDVGYDGPPFRWDPKRRFLLRAELDAAFFHFYTLSRNDTDLIRARATLAGAQHKINETGDRTWQS